MKMIIGVQFLVTMVSDADIAFAEVRWYALQIRTCEQMNKKLMYLEHT